MSEKTFSGNKACRGFTLIEQLAAASLILIASLCILEAMIYCLLSLQASEEAWEQELLEWNQSQVELTNEEGPDEEETVIEAKTAE